MPIFVKVSCDLKSYPLKPSVHILYHLVRPLRPIKYEGEASASAFFTWRGEEYLPECAFKNDPSCWWAVNPVTQQNRPALIYFCWAEKFVIAKFGFENQALKESPKRLDAIGSMDGINWTTLLEIQNAEFSEGNQFRIWKIPAENRRPFACFGLKVFSSIDDEAAAIRNMIIWH